MDLHRLIDRYIEIVLRVGLNLANGQELVILASVEANDFVRRLSVAAYRSGATLVTVVFEDPWVQRERLRHAHDASFDEAPGWLFDGVAKALSDGAARLWIISEDPVFFAQEDPQRLSRLNAARWDAMSPVNAIIGKSLVNWCVIGCPGASWAQLVFPASPPDEAVNSLWHAILSVCRVDGDEPVLKWTSHCEALRRRAAHLDERRYAALRFRGPGTDLMVGLLEDHTWVGGATRAANDIEFVANIPTEEIFTAPHRDQTEGMVTSTQPLFYNGVMIGGIQMQFRNGKVTQASAETGEEALVQLLQTDQGACMLGEVALVPHSSPISRLGVLFRETLYDENAASHIALGRCYADSIRRGANRLEDELRQMGANDSIVHVDWMIGSENIDVDGILRSGKTEPVMRQGEWATAI